MKRILVVITLLLACRAHAFSQTGEDITDLWWNPAESGWGMNVIQQGDTSFVTMFVYGERVIAVFLCLGGTYVMCCRLLCRDGLIM